MRETRLNLRTRCTQLKNT